MNNLFEFNENFEVVLDPQVNTLKPFRAIIDKYKDRELGRLELSYIVFLLHPKSDFMDVLDEKERSKAILTSTYRGKELKLDKKTQEAIEFYKERFYTIKINYLQATLETLGKMIIYLKDIDFSKKDDKDNPVYDPKKIIDVIASSPKLMASIKELEDQIRKESEVDEQIKGSGEKGVYED